MRAVRVLWAWLDLDFWLGLGLVLVFVFFCLSDVFPDFTLIWTIFPEKPDFYIGSRSCGRSPSSEIP